MIDGFLTAFGWTAGIVLGIYTAMTIVENASSIGTWIKETVEFARWK